MAAAAAASRAGRSHQIAGRTILRSARIRWGKLAGTAICWNFPRTAASTAHCSSNQRPSSGSRRAWASASAKNGSLASSRSARYTDRISLACWLSTRFHFLALGGSGDAVRQNLLELHLAAGDARLDGTDGNFEDLRDLLVGVLFHVKQRERRLVEFIDLPQRFDHGTSIQLIHRCRRDWRQLVFHLLKFVMRETSLPTPRFDELMVERGEQPGLHLRGVTELVALGRPRVKCLLCEVGRLGFIAGQAGGKLVERTIITAHQTFKVRGGGHLRVIRHKRRCRRLAWSHRCVTAGTLTTFKLPQTGRRSKWNCEECF